MAKLKIPYFSRGSLEDLNRHLKSGIYKNLDRIVWHYVTEGEAAGQLVLVYADKTLRYMHDTDLAGEVDTIASQVQENVANIQALSDHLDNLQILVDDHAERIAVLEDTATTHDGQIAEQASALTNLSQSLSALSETVNGLLDTVSAQGTSITDLSTTVNSQGEILSGHTATLTDHTQTLASHDQTLASHTEELSNHSTTLEAHRTRLNSYAESINTQTQTLGEHAAAIATLGSTTATQGESIAQQALAIDGLQDNKADKATTLAGYGITNADTSAEVDAKISNAIGDIGGGSTISEYVNDQIEQSKAAMKDYVDTAIGVDFV